jgi:DNA-binding MarR family transcriptional regulator
MEFVSEFRLAVTRLVRLQRSRYQRDPADLLPFSLGSVLYTLSIFGPATVTRLAELEAVSKPAMTRTVAALEERGLLRRETDGSDRRQALIFLTPEGRSMMVEGHRRADEWFLELFARLDDAEIASIRKAVSAITRLATDER